MQTVREAREQVQSWDFYTPEVSLNPHPLLATVRQAARAMWHETYQAWIVPHHDDIVSICRDEKNFTARDGIVAHNFGEFTVLAQDGALHRALHTIWSAPFLKQTLERLVPEIRATSLRLLQPAAEAIAAGEAIDMAPVAANSRGSRGSISSTSFSTSCPATQLSRPTMPSPSRLEVRKSC